MKIIETQNLNKIYKHAKLSVEVLKGITLFIEEGEFVSIVGPSGSGKTTLLYVLSGLEPYSAGEVLMFGKPLNQYSDSEKASLRSKEFGFVFQFYNLIPNLNVYENILLASVLGDNKDKKHIDEILAMVGMDEFKHYYPNQLSGGMQQRVAIARALINNPKIIFADEPIGNLDYKNGLAIMALFKELNRKHQKTIVMVSHNPDTTQYGTRCIHMLDGQVVKDEIIMA